MTALPDKFLFHIHLKCYIASSSENTILFSPMIHIRNHKMKTFFHSASTDWKLNQLDGKINKR